MGALRASGGTLPNVESADFTIIPAQGYEDGGTLTGLALVFLLARAFSSGCAALTGVEAISNGVPAFRRPKSRNAATTLLLLGTIAVSMLMSIIVLAHHMQIKYVDDVSRLRDAEGNPMKPGYDQPTVMAQISKAVFDNFTPGFYFVLAATGAITASPRAAPTCCVMLTRPERSPLSLSVASASAMPKTAGVAIPALRVAPARIAAARRNHCSEARATWPNWWRIISCSTGCRSISGAIASTYSR